MQPIAFERTPQRLPCPEKLRQVAAPRRLVFSAAQSLRLGGVVGVVNLDVVAEVTVALAGKMLRARLGCEWPVARYIVSRMAHAPKCRTARRAAAIIVVADDGTVREIRVSPAADDRLPNATYARTWEAR